jgi:hypothetical protein
MKAHEARKLTEKSFSERGWVEQLTKLLEEEDPTIAQEVLVNSAWEVLKILILERAEAGKSHVMTEPFAHIPGKLYSFDRSKLMADELCLILEGNGYRNIEWDHRDKRVVLQFQW